MKQRYVIHLSILLLMLASQATLSQGLARTMYLNVPQENLRIAPNGKKIGELLEGTEMTILVDQEKWVKVQLTGWIWKESLTSVRPSIATGEFRALHILVKTREEAESILAELKAGKDFREIAKQKSIAPSAAKGGDLGYFNSGDFDIRLERAINDLEIDELSPIVETEYGFNIFKRIK
jgi:foldase protein PrsA